MPQLIMWLLVAINLIISPSNGYADSTNITPPSIQAVAPSGDGVPIGTIIAWPVSTNPEGWSEGLWLECNGQAISASSYPELRAIVGANVPDLRGLFLRGTVGNAASLGSIQEDAGRNITGGVETRDNISASVGQFWRTSGAFMLTEEEAEVDCGVRKDMCGIETCFRCFKGMGKLPYRKRISSSKPSCSLFDPGKKMKF